MQSNPVSTYIKEQRKNNNLTQQQLAHKSGVGLRFIRELEQGKQTLMIHKINNVLWLFGMKCGPKPILIKK